MNIQTIERAKLRQLRNEINTAAQARLEHQRNYTPRGYPRQTMPNLPQLAPEGLPSNGPTPLRQMCPRTGMDLPAAAANLRQACAGGRCKGCAAAGVEQRVTA